MFEYFHNFFYDTDTFTSVVEYLSMFIVFLMVIAMVIIAFIVRKIRKGMR